MSIDFEKYAINEAPFDKSLNEYLQLKINSSLVSNNRYMVIIHIDSIQIRPDRSSGLEQAEYHSYLRKTA